MARLRRKIDGIRTAQVEVFGRKAQSGFVPTMDELRYISTHCVGDSYMYYSALLAKAKSIVEIEQLSDEVMAKVMGTSPATAKKRRLSLTNAKLIKSVKVGTITYILIGYEAVYLYELRGSTYVNHEVMTKLKRRFKVRGLDDFIAKLPIIEETYKQNPSDWH